jgi:hypothetical protein
MKCISITAALGSSASQPITSVTKAARRVKYGLSECPVHVAGKSGVFAALAAHGVVPIHPDGAGTFEGLEFGRDTVNISAVTRAADRPGEQEPDGVSVRTWYRKHRLDRQVSDTWIRLLARP